jgi:hypothetical protein
MNTFAYCARQFEEATRKAAGVNPLLSPPLTSRDGEILLGWMAWARFVYFDLHGFPGGTCWLGDDHVAAIRADQLAEADLSETVVFAANCHLADRESVMMDALLEAGATYVVAGEGPNQGPTAGRLYGAPLLGLWFRRIVAFGMEPLLALTWAKKVVRVDEVLVGGQAAAADVDAMGFRAYVRNEGRA